MHNSRRNVDPRSVYVFPKPSVIYEWEVTLSLAHNTVTFSHDEGRIAAEIELTFRKAFPAQAAGRILISCS